MAFGPRTNPSQALSRCCSPPARSPPRRQRHLCHPGSPGMSPGARSSPTSDHPSPGDRLDGVFLSPPLSGRAGGKILGVLALFLVMVWYSIYREDRYIQL